MPNDKKKSELACDPCRQLKVKCIRSNQAGDENICQKCKRHNVDCTWSTIKVRIRKPRSKAAARIQALESKIDQLLSTVEQGSPASTTSATLSDVSSRNMRHQIDENIPELLAQQFGVGEAMADQYLENFRAMTLYFPFIVIPSSTTAAMLAATRPMLLLAILTASSVRNYPLQAGLEAMLRRGLVERTLVRQERSLELLASLLVYLGWSQFYTMPRRDSAAQFMWLAVSMCDDLGLGLTKEEAQARQFQPHIAQVSHDAQYLSAEARRLYLGTYWILNDHNWTFAEITKVADWEHVKETADTLAFENEYATDVQIACLARMQSLATAYHNIFADYAAADLIDPLQLSAQLDEVEEGMLDIGNELPGVLSHSVLMDLTRYTALMYTFESRLINPLIRRKIVVLPQNQYLLTTVLVRCLDASCFVINTFLTIPYSEYNRLSQHQWTGLDHAIVVLYKLSLGLSHLTAWDIELARARVSVEDCLDQLIQRLILARAADQHDSNRRDLYTMHSRIWQSTLEAYSRKKDLPLADRLASSSMEVHQKAFADVRGNIKNDGKQGILRDAASHPCPAYIWWKP